MTIYKYSKETGKRNYPKLDKPSRLVVVNLSKSENRKYVGLEIIREVARMESVKIPNFMKIIFRLEELLLIAIVVNSFVVGIGVQ